MMKNVFDKKTTLLAAVMSAAMVISVLFTVGIYFETNDDRCITEILAGIISTGPDAHAVYINYLLALPLAFAYRITSAVPWYGGCLILFQLLSYFCMLDSAYSCCRNRKDIIGVSAMWAAFFLSNLYLTGQIQYTSTAALSAIAGYVCLILNKKGKWGILQFGLLELLALLLRDQAMLMIQPFGMAVWAGLSIGGGKDKRKGKVLQILRPVLVILSVFVIGIMGNVVGYHSGEWKEYETFNQARTEMFDYYGVPAYAEVKPILDQYEVTEAEYKAFQLYDSLDWDVSAACAQELAQYARTHSAAEPGWKEVLQTFMDYLFHGKVWGINTLMLVACLMLAAYIALRRKWYLIWPGAGLAAVTAVVWGFLIWKGRLPLRVNIPLFACVTALVLALLLRDASEAVPDQNNHIRSSFVLLLFCAVFLWKGVSSGRAQYSYVRQANDTHEIYIDGMRQLQDYCREHPDRRYVIEAGSLSFYRGSALETDIYQPRNSIVSGCWYSNSPSMRKKLQEYLTKMQDGIYIILYEGNDSWNHAITEYLSEKTGNTPIKQEEIKVSNGAVYGVYHFDEI